MAGDYKYQDLTDKIIECFYQVYNTLGYGFLEQVYEKALQAELIEQGLKAERQVPIQVQYKGKIVGDYFADVIVNQLVILELKACEALNESHSLQLINYLKASETEVGLLLNFGKKPQIVRKISTNK